MTPLPVSAATPKAAAREGRPYRHAGTWRPHDAAVDRGGHHHRYAVYGVIFRPPIAPDLYDRWAEASISHDLALLSGITASARDAGANPGPDAMQDRIGVVAVPAAPGLASTP